MNIRKNKGMFLESILNRSCEYLIKQKIGFVEKRFTKIHVSSVNGKKVCGFFGTKNYVDYSGFIDNKIYQFEAKSTSSDCFYISNIKKSQIAFFEMLKSFNVERFFIIYFSKHKRFFKISYGIIKIFINKNKKAIYIEDCYFLGKELKIVYPGIINFWKTKNTI